MFINFVQVGHKETEEKEGAMAGYLGNQLVGWEYVTTQFG